MTQEGFKGMTARFAVTKVDGCPNDAMRIMEFEPEGHTSFHSHQEEHEFYFVEGTGEIVTDGGQTIPVRAGDLIFIAPREKHQVKNTGNTLLRLVCTIPILPGGDGIHTTQ